MRVSAQAYVTPVGMCSTLRDLRANAGMFLVSLESLPCPFSVRVLSANESDPVSLG
jgi:hypothetical protein